MVLLQTVSNSVGKFIICKGNQHPPNAAIIRISREARLSACLLERLTLQAMQLCKQIQIFLGRQVLVES